MARRSTQDVPYQQSRAALRERFGTRAIDASAPQSAKDTTPSGRAKYLEQTELTPKGEPISENEARAMVREEFRGKFRAPIEAPNPNPPVAPPLLTRSTRQNPMFAGGLASPEDVGIVRSQGGTGTLQTPYGSVTLGLLPETAPPDEMAPFLPTTVSPLSNFSLPQRKPLNSFLTPQSQWRKPLFG